MGLLGNPSDVYQGRALGFPLRELRAEVEIEPAADFVLEPGPAETLRFASAREAFDTVQRLGCDDGIRLLRAALRRFGACFPECAALAGDDPRGRFHLRYRTAIPRQVGLAGSSAIVIAALRALADWYEVELEPFALSELALEAETGDLGITAGPMDRAVQAYDAFLAMDFREPRRPASYQRLDPAMLPPLFVAYDEVGEVSGRVHSDVRGRWLRGDPEVRRAMEVFPRLADEGLACLRAGDLEGFRAAVDRNFDTRASIYALPERDCELVAIARRHGAAAKLCGSGGAAVGVPARAGDWPDLERACREAGFRAFRPELAAAGEAGAA